MDGGGVVATQAGIVTVWRRDRSLFPDRPGNPELEIGEGTDVSISAARNGVSVIWTTPASIVVRSPGETRARSIGKKGSFPSIAGLSGGGAIAAWESDGRIVIQCLRQVLVLLSALPRSNPP